MRKFELSPPSSSNRNAKVVLTDPMEVEARLHELHPDLKAALFRIVVIGGLSARNEVTPASAPTAAGVKQWLATVEELRTLLAQLQWRIHENKNCPFISSPDRAVSIVVMTGNAETGMDVDEGPANQAEKGAVAEGYVQKNWSQLELFNHDAFKLVKDKQKETQVWVLLYHYDRALKQVRFELSLPTGFSKKKITDWGERLVFGAIPNDPATFVIRKDEPIEPATVDVVPKMGAF
ncbi:hypothetical protein AOT14_30950 [Stenotrophomonas acidaminiphila]|uniref:Uncharacterized protein n=1 Tax=Stenotrophomonas acidaminiphila TaxID=128780 RepID=A0A0S1B362_9GAMM|nr:hypothetical protein [Stenotrophomonas acidaminiphila]ALJ29442.1 hypothetical protein AOT14_30950 [Stenotrophomonas acidaminiphila]